jgi:hypothetical protein
MPLTSEKNSALLESPERKKLLESSGMCSVGSYLATRLEQVGSQHHFAVAGDYNLVLLDHLLGNKNLQQLYC